MSKAYCIKCKCKNELTNTHIAYASNGTPMEKGKCSVCGTNTSRFLNKEEKAKLVGQPEVTNSAPTPEATPETAAEGTETGTGSEEEAVG